MICRFSPVREQSRPRLFWFGPSADRDPSQNTRPTTVTIARRFPQVLSQILREFGAAGRRRVASIGERVDENLRHARGIRGIRKRHEDVRNGCAHRHQKPDQEMQPAPAASAKGLLKNRVALEFAFAIALLIRVRSW